MTTIHKYELQPLPGYQGVKIRQNAKLLKISTQQEKIVLWYEVYAHEAQQWVEFLLIETGQAFDEMRTRREYRETIQIDDYELHIYQLGKEEK